MSYDVAIVGGGPAGSTCASLLKKYEPDLRVVILERERFPRERGGEILLQPVTRILSEMGVWDAVEAAGFPIGTGTLFRWGVTRDLWKLDFLNGESLGERNRPETLAGPRVRTTFHCERARYDEILLNHAASLGAEVRQGAEIVEVLRAGDRVQGLRLADGSEVTATWYVDASGRPGAIRGPMAVGIEEPSKIRSVAAWSYWTNDAWDEHPPLGDGRARVLSVRNGWVWLAPQSETRASVGFVTDERYLEDGGFSPEELYESALREEPFVARVLSGATSDGRVRTAECRSFVAERMAGENWFLAGDAAGSSDPVLGAGVALAQMGARELAHILLALHREEHDPAWLKEWYGNLTQRRLRQHVRFGDFWYSANPQITDLQKYTGEVAADGGFDVNAQDAFQWLSQIGFAVEQLTSPSFGPYGLTPAKAMLGLLTGQEVDWQINHVNDLKLNLGGAKSVHIPSFRDGRIETMRGFQRGAQLLPLEGFFNLVINAINHERETKAIMHLVRMDLGIPPNYTGYHPQLVICLEAIEAMLAEGWVRGSVNKKRPFVKVALVQDTVAPVAKAPEATTIASP